MAEVNQKKLDVLIKALAKSYEPVTRPDFLPPPSSADADAALAVSRKNSEIIGGAVLGLHGPPMEGYEAARKIMELCVDWNEVRVSNVGSLVRCLGPDPRAQERITLLQRFLESFFLRQRNLNLDYLVGLKPTERRVFLSTLEVFNREELAALLLACFVHNAFPPSDTIHELARDYGVISEKTTVLQMAKQFETIFPETELLNVYSNLYALALTPEEERPVKTPKSARKKAAV